MTPLSDDDCVGEDRVKVIVGEAIEKYDQKQEVRHRDNVQRLDTLTTTVGTMNTTMQGWQAIVNDRKERKTLWYPILTSLLVGLLAAACTLLAVKWHP